MNESKTKRFEREMQQFEISLSETYKEIKTLCFEMEKIISKQKKLMENIDRQRLSLAIYIDEINFDGRLEKHIVVNNDGCIDIPGDNSLTTKELADLLRVKTSTISNSVCVKGHYLDNKPIKMPNGRLLWVKSDFKLDKYKSAQKELKECFVSPIKS
jgi:hypothetical protein